MIDIKDITVALSGRTILENCSLHVARNQKLAVSGASGSGKSTLLRTLIGRHRPRRGAIAVDGMSLTRQNLCAIRSLVYYLPQDILPIGEETGRDFLMMPFSLSVNRGKRFDETEAASWFDALGLKSHLFESRLPEMSGGETKRLGMVQALLLDRPIWILDELTASVDEHNAEVLVELLLGQRDKTVIAVTHDVAFIEKATEHVVIRNGRAVASDGSGDGGRNGRR